MHSDRNLLQRFLSSIPVIDLMYICSGKMTKIYSELSYLSRRKLVIAWFEHLLYAVIGFLLSTLLGAYLTIMIYAISFSIGFPVEVYISRFVRLTTWEWAMGKSLKQVFTTFIWSGVNVTLYFMIGLALSALMLG